MKKKFQLSKLVTMFIALFMTIQLVGQETTNLFKNVSKSKIGFDLKQSEKLDKMIENPIYLSHFFVEVNDLIEVQENGTIHVNLPDKEGTELFVGQEIKYSNPNEYMFYGELDPCNELRMGYIHLIAKEGNVFGQINIEDEIYELQDFGDHKNVLFKIDPSIYNEAECATEHEGKGEGKKVNHSIQNRSSGGCNVRVLVLFTAAADAVGNPQNSANLFIQQTNQSVCNSDADVSFTLAGVQELVGFTETNDPTTTRDNLQADPDANQLRDDFQADLVVLLTDGNWNTFFGQVFGISFLNNWGDPDFGYAVSEIDAAGGRFTFTHEIAHDFGCKHNTDNRGAPDFVFDARGHNFKTGWWPFRKTRRTIMNTLGNGSRIMHFSNPDVEFKNKDTGVSDERENADQLSAEACAIANYRDFTPPLNVNISGPTWGDNSGTYTWCANITSCPNPTSIFWEYSIDGFTYFPWSLSQNQVCISGSLPLNQSLWLRVTVTCDDGSVDTDWHFIWNEDEWDPCDDMKQKLADHPTEIELRSTTNINDVVVYPNPLQDNINIELNLIEESRVEPIIYELSGREVMKLSSVTLEKGKHALTYDVSSLNPGIYFLKTSIKDEIITKSIIKL